MRQGDEAMLVEAATEKEVVQVARDFLRGWWPEELALLPPTCRPGKILDAGCIAACALELKRATIGSEAAPAPLAEMEAFFARACERLTQVQVAAIEG